jgi:hypothetical protein
MWKACVIRWVQWLRKAFAIIEHPKKQNREIRHRKIHPLRMAFTTALQSRCLLRWGLPTLFRDSGVGAIAKMTY